MKFALKIWPFIFCKVIVGFKMKIKGAIKNLKIKKIKKMIIVKYI